VHVTNIVLETQPGRARSVADLMGRVKGMALLSVQGDHRVLATWSIPDGQHPEPEGLSEVLRAMSADVLEVALLGEEERD
jgi:hypothetical protein